jgi:indoleamine 2,3-dioxygenase
MPRVEPLQHLPPKFAPVEKLLDAMTIEQPNGKKGLLWTGDFGKAVEKELPLIDVSDVKDPVLLSALFRDYAYIASSYLLEPCDIEFRKSKSYGLARDILPK